MYSITRQHHTLHDANRIPDTEDRPFGKSNQKNSEKLTYPKIQSRSWSLVLLWLSVLFCLIPMTSGARAAQVTLAWDANASTPEGYRLYQRMENGSYNYAQPVWTGTSSDTQATVDGLADETTYYFVVRAYEDDEESENSNEVAHTTPAADEDETDDNQAPVADAGSNQTVTSQTLVTLNGSNSYDPENQSLTYRWSQSSGETTVTISNSEAAVATFTAPEPSGETATLAFELTVTDSQGLSSTDTCLIQVQSSSSDDDASDDDDSDDSTDTEVNHAPQQPSIISPADGDTVNFWGLTIESSAFSDPDSEDWHAQTQWIISNLEGVEVLNWSNGYFLEWLWIPASIIDPETTYTCKVRYFDDQGLASEWSEEISFTTGTSGSRSPRRDATTSQIIDTYDNQSQVEISLDGAQIDAQIASALTYSPDSFQDYASFNTDELTFGMISYRIEGVPEGESVAVTLSFPDPLDEGLIWDYFDASKTDLQPCSDTQMNSDGYSIERQLTDGGDEDADGVVNGIIVDIVGPRTVSEESSSSGDGGGSGSGGCFIQSILQ